MYKLVFAPQATEDLSKLKKSEPAAFKKSWQVIGGTSGTPEDRNWKA